MKKLSLLLIISLAVLLQVFCLPHSAFSWCYDADAPIVVKLSASPQGVCSGSSTSVTVTLTAFDIDRHGDPEAVWDDLQFTGWDGPDPVKGADGIYRSTYTFTPTTDEDIQVWVDDVWTYADDPYTASDWIRVNYGGLIGINGPDNVCTSSTANVNLSLNLCSGFDCSQVEWYSDNSYIGSGCNLSTNWTTPGIYTLMAGDPVTGQWITKQINVEDCSGAHVYVKTPGNGGSDANDGFSWLTAKATLPGALSVVAADGTICVAQGIYTGGITLKSSDNGPVKMYGAFPPNGGTFEERDPAAHTTYIDTGGPVVTIPAEAGSTTVLDGFKIVNGLHSGTGHVYGGGIVCYSSAPTISNNLIDDNNIQGLPGVIDRCGGGIALINSNAKVVNNEFFSNGRLDAANNKGVDYGGALYISGGSPSIGANYFTQNYAQLDGGNIYHNSNGNVAITDNNVIAGLAGRDGGGIYSASSASGTAEISGNKFFANTAAVSGGNLYVTGDVQVVANDVRSGTSNGASNGSYTVGGGGFYIGQAKGQIARNKIYGGNASNVGGGIVITNSGNTSYDLNVENNILYSNHATSLGGGIYAEGYWNIRNNTLARNSSNHNRGGGGVAIYNKYNNTTCSLANNIVALNTNGGVDSISFAASVIARNDVWGNTINQYTGIGNQTGVNGNISQDPLFASDPNYDYHILTGSPCIDKIDPTLAPNSDFDDDVRPLEGDATEPAKSDMGADELYTDTIGENTPDDWTMFMHDKRHTGSTRYMKDNSTTETLTLAWPAPVTVPVKSGYRSFKMDYIDVNSDGNYVSHPRESWYPNNNSWILDHPTFDSSPVVYGNTLVVGGWTSGGYMSSTGTVYAFNAETGASRWTASVTPGMGGVATTPCIYNGMVFVSSANGYLYCLDLATGNQIWSRQTTDRQGSSSRIVHCSPVVHNGWVYVGNETSKLYAFSADRLGIARPGYPVSLPIDSPTHIDPITDQEQQMICGTSSPAIANVDGITYLLIGSDDGYLYRIEPINRSVADVRFGFAVESSPTVAADGTVYVGTSVMGDSLHRVNIATMQEIGTYNCNHEARTTPSLRDGFVYEGSDTGHEFFKFVQGATGTVGNDAPWCEGLFVHGLWQDGDSPYEKPSLYWLGSPGHTKYLTYIGQDSGYFWCLGPNDVPNVKDFLPLVASYPYPVDYWSCGGEILSSPAIAYNVDSNHNRWVFITQTSSGGVLYAFKTNRTW